MAVKADVTYVIAHSEASYQYLKAESLTVDAKVVAAYQDIAAVEVKLDADTLNRYFRTDTVVIGDVLTFVYEQAFEDTVGTGDSISVTSGKALVTETHFPADITTVFNHHGFTK